MSDKSSHNTNLMWGGRFSSQQDNIMETINSSIEIDHRMAMQDIEGSLVHVKMLQFKKIIPLISKFKYKKIIISPRNKQIAKSLKKKFKKIVIAKDNQQIVDQSNWVFLSITPTVGEKIIKDLKFKSSQTIVSFISTITLSQLKKEIGRAHV